MYRFRYKVQYDSWKNFVCAKNVDTQFGVREKCTTECRHDENVDTQFRVRGKCTTECRHRETFPV